MYRYRDERVENMTDETTETYYSCTLCQSFAPNHVCVVSPERTGLCGAYNWMDCKASFEINPTGPNQPIEKGEVLDSKLGQWKGVNDFVYKASRQAVTHYNFYSMVYRSHDHLRLLRMHRRGAAHLQRHHDRSPGLHRHDPLRHEVHHPGRRHGRRRSVTRIRGTQQVQHHPA